MQKNIILASIFVLSLPVIVSVLCIVDQCILWGLTACKYRNAIRVGLSRYLIVRRVMRHILWVVEAFRPLFIFTYILWSLSWFTATVPSPLVHSVGCTVDCEGIRNLAYTVLFLASLGSQYIRCGGILGSNCGAINVIIYNDHQGPERIESKNQAQTRPRSFK
jgi:hypothetical protein